MAMWSKCNKCNKVHRYDKSDIENIGTFWNPKWMVICINCGNKIIQNMGSSDDMSSSDIIDNSYIRRTEEGILLKKKPIKQKNNLSRAKSGDIKEYWIQKYVSENYKKLGFEKIDGPFDRGPDFTGIYKGNEIKIEVERNCRTYIQHKHHEDKRFEDVKVLIVLSQLEPSPKIIPYLPNEIIYINVDDFIKWWQPKAEAYAKEKNLQGIFIVLENEFKKRFIDNCSDKERDLSTCPNCNLCAYFSEETSLILKEMVLKFILQFDDGTKEQIISENFKLSSINPSDIDDFYKLTFLNLFYQSCN